jgi:hypothetical protein
MTRLLAFFACASLLAGCGGTLEEKGADVRDAQPCCAELGGIRYAALQVGEARLHSVSPGDPVFAFDTGKSRFAAFELPATRPAVRLTVESYMQFTLQSPTKGEQYFFAPRLLLLDAAHRPLRALEADPGRVHYVPVTEFGTTGGVGWKLVLQADIGAGDNARYAIVHTTDRLLGQVTAVSSPYSGAHRELPHAPTGRLRVSLAPIF